MAIGDNNNSNLFGTNYNAEEEERKKALLAAQNARMGAGNVPASAFGQAPAVAPFSMEAAGQVNPMMQLQSLEAPVSAPNPVTFLPYADDVSTPRASALSVFAPGGEVKPNVDVNAITPSPTTLPDPNAVNTALNQEVPVDPVNNEPGFLYNTFVNAPVQADQRATEFMSNLGEKISAGYDNLLGSAMRNLTPVEDRRFANNEPFGKTFTDTFAITRPDGTKFYPDEVTTPGGTTQAPSVASALGDTQGVTPTTETPSEGAQGQKATLDPTSDEAILANRAQREAQFAQAGGLTTVGGASLSEFLSGQAMPEQGFTQEESPLGGRGVTLTQDQMNTLSAERKARLDARPDFGEAVSDRDRRAARGDGISMADQTAMAKANARDASPSEVARGNQVANALGVELETGQPLQATGGLTESELQRRREFAYKQEQDILAGETKAKETEGDRSVNRAKAVGSLQALKADLDLIKETGEEVRTLTLKPRTEGLLAKMLATVSPTSTAAQLERASGVLTGDAFIKGMQVIKAFGGGLGSVTEVEGLKVERAQGAIFENGMGDEERRQAVKDYIQVRENAYNRIREAFVKEYGETDAQTYLGTKNANATTGQAIPNDRNVASAADTLLSDPKYNK